MDLEQKARELWCAEAARIGVTYAAGEPSSDQPCVRAVLAGMRWAAEECARIADGSTVCPWIAQKIRARFCARQDESPEALERLLTALIADAEEDAAIAETNKPEATDATAGLGAQPREGAASEANPAGYRETHPPRSGHAGNRQFTPPPAPTHQLARPSSCRLDDQGPVAATLKADPDNLPSGLRQRARSLQPKPGISPSSERAALVERAMVAYESWLHLRSDNRKARELIADFALAETAVLRKELEALLSEYSKRACERDAARALASEMRTAMGVARSEADAARAEVAEWNDPDSQQRMAIMEQIIFDLGDGLRSEIELREAQLDAAEAANVALRAEVERLTRERDEALQLAEGPSTLKDLAALAFELGLEVERLRKIEADRNRACKDPGIDALRAARESKETQ